jgi:hypothetical protein
LPRRYCFHRFSSSSGNCCGVTGCRIWDPLKRRSVRRSEVVRFLLQWTISRLIQRTRGKMGLSLERSANQQSGDNGGGVIRGSCAAKSVPGMQLMTDSTTARQSRMRHRNIWVHASSQPGGTGNAVA